MTFCQRPVVGLRLPCASISVSLSLAILTSRHACSTQLSSYVQIACLVQVLFLRLHWLCHHCPPIAFQLRVALRTHPPHFIVSHVLELVFWVLDLGSNAHSSAPLPCCFVERSAPSCAYTSLSRLWSCSEIFGARTPRELHWSDGSISATENHKEWWLHINIGCLGVQLAFSLQAFSCVDLVRYSCLLCLLAHASKMYIFSRMGMVESHCRYLWGYTQSLCVLGSLCDAHVSIHCTFVLIHHLCTCHWSWKCYPTRRWVS